MAESQTDLSSQETIIDPDVVIRLEKRIKNWMLEAALLTNSLQDIPPSNRRNVGLSIKQWLREQKEIVKPAFLTQLLQSMLSSSAETSIGSNFHLEAQDSKLSNKRISKVPETSNLSARKKVQSYVVEAVDKPLDQNVLNEASGKMSEVRLVIKSPYIRNEDLDALVGSIRYPSRAPRFKHMFGVIQDALDFTVKLDLRFNVHMVPFNFWCDIVYDPASDDCHLHNRSTLTIYLISSGESPTEHTIDYERQKTICSGAWRISIKPDQTTNCFYPIFDILIRDRRFSISADNDRKVPTVMGTNLFPRDPREVQYTPISWSRTRTSILDLADGEMVRIKDFDDDEKTYSLQRFQEIATSSTTSVFSCRHSRLPSIKLVAKVFLFNKKRLTQERMKREMDFLARLRHSNIISLKAADPRVFALYLEHLPLSLDKNHELESSWADAKTVLFDISSALAYLSRKGIVHYDVKPANIAFCRKRGAILFDFDLADYSKNPKYRSSGGTFRFLPPETIQEEETRGHPGDVWALGVTILWIVKMDTDSSYALVNMDHFHKPHSSTYQMVRNRLQYIASQRDVLNLEDKVQALVYKMLEPIIKARVTAAAILSADDRKSVRGVSVQKRKHSSIT